jgi:hypothetical protein
VKNAMVTAMSNNLLTGEELSLAETHKKIWSVQRESKPIREATVKYFLTVRQEGLRRIHRKLEFCGEAKREIYSSIRQNNQ